MQKSRLVNLCIWALNALLGAGVIVFLYRFVLFPPRTTQADNLGEDSGLGDTSPAPEIQKKDVNDYKFIWTVALPPPQKAPEPGGAGLVPVVPIGALFRLTLVTVCEAAPELGSIVVEKKQGGEQRFLMVGDKWENVTGPGTCLELKEVKLVKAGEFKEYQATVVYNGKVESLKFIEGPPGPVVAEGRTKPAVPTAASPSDFKSYTDPNDPTRWYIDVREREYMFQNEALVLGQVDMRPYVQDGVTTGMLVNRVDAGSLAERRGLKQGDIVRTVNGIQVDSFEAARKIMQDKSIRSADTVVVELERVGQKMQATFQIFAPQ